MSVVEISVLIPVLNEQDNLREAAEAMLAQQTEGEAEFLFIDGGSTDASPQILEELASSDSRVRVLANPARRTPQALNVGLRASQGEFVARMDAHTIYPANYLASGAARLRRGGVDWVSGPQLAVGTNPGSRRVARALSASLGKGGARFRDQLESEHEVDSGFTGVWRRETLERHEGWDEEWLNDQDLELAARIRKGGGRIVCIPEMAAQYVPRDSLSRLSRQYRTYGLYRVKTARRHPETLRPSQLLPVAVTVAATTAALPGSPKPIRRAALAGLALYGIAIGASAGREARGGEVREAAALPAVWGVMHFSYGVGFARGCLRYGVPVGAVASMLRWRGERGYNNRLRALIDQTGGLHRLSVSARQGPNLR